MFWERDRLQIVPRNRETGEARLWKSQGRRAADKNIEKIIDKTANSTTGARPTRPRDRAPTTRAAIARTAHKHRPATSKLGE